MKYILKNLCIPAQFEQDIPGQICSKLKIKSSSLLNWSLNRKALDTRKKNNPVYVYTIELETGATQLNHPDLLAYREPIHECQSKTKLHDQHPVIIGMGPAGLFCALAMVENGLKPILYDRGDRLEDRTIAVNKFWQSGILDTDSNVQFGEGGAGAFSDGKLTSRAMNYSTQKVYDLLIRFGAHDSIKWEALPHLGTDIIRQTVQNIRDYLIEKGCSFQYRRKLNAITTNQNAIDSIKINDDVIKPEILILAIGNAARDTFRTLYKSGVSLESKPFSIGFRISHPQDWINKSIYGSNAWAEKLGAASYRLTASQAGKGTYTFCMCPGGFVIAAASEPNTTVTNGMSYSQRDHSLGNSAVVTNIDKSDYGSGLWDGMELQIMLEKKAFIDRYAAPIQKAEDYIKRAISNNVNHNCLFSSAQSVQIRDIFPEQLNQALISGLKHFNYVLPGFIEQGIIIAPETRTSSPIRILRDKEKHNCQNIRNLYAIGEGSGYAGGIISSAADGYSIGSQFCL